MRISNARVFADGVFQEGGIEFDTRITALGDVTGGEDAEGCYLIPGLVDIHTHGAMGEDASDGIAEGLVTMSRYYARGGVTAWCPTTMTVSEPEIVAALETIRNFVRPEDGAKAAGIHLEGPFLCYAKRGAQAAENLRKPDAELFCRFNEVSGKAIRLVTVACEEEGGMDFIDRVSPVCTVSLGHTVATYDTAAEGYRRGASHATHLYNGMPALAHREPGVIGAARDAGATVELICDGLHIHPAVVRATFAMFGENVVLVSDSLRCAGMPDGDYVLGGQPITMTNGKATLSGSDTLAGSSIHLMDGLRNAVRFGIPLEAAVTAATAAPARAIRMEHQLGRLAVGRCADLVLLDKDLQVKAVYVDGNRIL